MFDKRTEAESKKQPAPLQDRPSPTKPAVRSSSLIGVSIRIKGDIEGDDNLVIEGHVDGSVRLPSNELTISTSGEVNAEVTAKTVKIDGSVIGDVQGSEIVVVSKTGKVQGNITSPRVTLEDGAKFKDSIDMDPGSIKGSQPVAEEPRATYAVPAKKVGAQG
jgi:cytoskeletal protein CcmA (bactofilin family)